MFPPLEFAALVRQAIKHNPELRDVLAEIVNPTVVKLPGKDRPELAPMPRVDVSLVLISAHWKATMVWEDTRGWKRPPRFVDIVATVLDEVLDNIDQLRLSSNDKERVKAVRAQALTWAARWDAAYSDFKLDPKFKKQLKRRARARRMNERVRRG
jgi:hypothetical protein